jgi:hypothetical protein
MTRIKLLSANLARFSTITGTAPASGFPLTRLTDDRISAYWASTGSSVALTCTFPGSRTFDTISLPVSTLKTGSTLTVASQTKTLAALTVDRSADLLPNTGDMFAYGAGRSITLHLSAPITASSVSIALAAASGTISAPFLVVGQSWSPSRNFALQATIGVRSASALSDSEAGDSLCDVRFSRKTFTFDVSAFTDAERAELFNYLLQNAVNHPILISGFPDHTDPSRENDFTIYGRLSPESQQKIIHCTKFTNTITVNAI